MFLFQLNYAAQSKISSLEDQLLKANPKDQKTLSSLQKAAIELSKANSDSKNQALAYFTLSWVAAKQAKLEITSNAANSAQTIGAALAQDANHTHYKNLFDVLEASRMESGELAITPAAIAKITAMLDIAAQNAATRQSAQGFLQTENNYFVFANQAEAKAFVKILDALPSSFSAIIGTAEKILGQDHVDRKNINGAYVVDFACTSYSDVIKTSKPAPSESKIKVSPGTRKRASVETKFSGSSADASEQALREYAKTTMAPTADGEGKADLSAQCDFFYAVKHKTDPTKDPESATKMATNAFREITRLMGIDMDKSMEPPPTLKKFLFETEPGAKFIKDFNLGAPKVEGSATVEVFYTGSNYEAFRNAVRDNWQLSLDRAELIKNSIDNYINNPKKPTLNVDVSGSLYFFQNLDEKVLTALQNDPTLSGPLKAWLSKYAQNQTGEAHMNKLMTYLRDNQGDDKFNSYNLLAKAIGKVNEKDGAISCDMSAADYSRLNTLWQRRSKNPEGLRVETLDRPSLLVSGIEAEGGRGAKLITNAKAPINVTITPPAQESIEIKAGESASISIGISSESPLGTPSVSAYLVNKGTGAIIPLTPKEGKYTAEVSEAGNYAVVAYASVDKGGTVARTKLAGCDLSVTLKVEEPEKLDRVKYRNRANIDGPSALVQGTVPAQFSIPGIPTPSNDSQMNDLIKDLVPVYTAIGVTVDNNGIFDPSTVPTSLTAPELAKFYSGFKTAMANWVESNKDLIMENLKNPNDYENFINALLQSNFKSALEFLNSDPQSECKGRLYNSLNGTFSSDAVFINTFLSPTDLNRLTKWSFSAEGSMNFMLTGTKYIDTYKKDEVAGKLSDANIIIPQNELDKALSKLKKKGDQAVAYTNKGEYAFAMGAKGQVSVYKLPKIPTELNLCLMENGNVTIFDATVHELKGVAMVIAQINLGKKVHLQPYVNVAAVHNLTAGSTDEIGVFFDTKRITVGVDFGAGAQVEYKFNDFISGLVEGGLGVSIRNKAQPYYGAVASAGVKLQPTENLGITLMMNSQFSPGEEPLYKARTRVKYDAGVVSISAKGEYSFVPNALGKHPWGIGVGLSFNL